jgi:hypothetical protein
MQLGPAGDFVGNRVGGATLGDSVGGSVAGSFVGGGVGSFVGLCGGPTSSEPCWVVLSVAWWAASSEAWWAISSATMSRGKLCETNQRVRRHAPPRRRRPALRVWGRLTVVDRHHLDVVARGNFKPVRAKVNKAVPHHLNVVLGSHLRVPYQLSAVEVQTNGAAESIRPSNKRRASASREGASQGRAPLLAPTETSQT